MNEKEFLKNNGVIFEDDYLEESPDEEIIYDWEHEIVYE